VKNRRSLGAAAADLAFPLAGVLLLLVGLEAWIRLNHEPRYVLVPVTDVIRRMVSDRSQYLSASWITLKEILLGLGLGIVLGVTLGIAIDAWRGFERRVYPLMLTSQMVPQVAYAPIIVIWFGFGLTPKVIVIAVFTFFPMVLGTVAGLRSAGVERLYLARSMGAGPAQTLQRIKLPAALPDMFSALKISATLAVIGAVVAEFISGSGGLGFLVVAAQGNLDIGAMLGAVGYLTLIGILLFLVVDRAERAALPWHVSHREAHAGL
jgi:NitT/TauT family transport system permease protein